MFDIANLQTCFTSLVGWRASQGCGDESLTAELMTSTSGLYVNDLPGIGWPLLAAIKEDWEGTMTQYLTNIHTAETQSLLSLFINGLKQVNISKELLTNQPLQSGVIDRENTTTLGGMARGYLIKPYESNSLRTELKELALMLTANQTVKLFLYDMSKTAPIAVYDFTYTLAKSEMWTQVTGFIMDYQNLTKSAGQHFLLLYYETNATNPKSWQVSTPAYTAEFCDCCCNGVKKVWQRWVAIRPIELPASVLNFNAVTQVFDCPDTQDIEGYCVTRSAGLNAKVNVTCDITQSICHNKDMFAEALQKRIACHILADALGTTRFNAISEANRERWQQFHDQYKGDLEGRYFGAGDKVVYNKGILKNLVIDFSNIDRVCLKNTPEIIIGRKERYDN